MEKWKDSYYYPELYSVSDKGRVIAKEKIVVTVLVALFAGSIIVGGVLIFRPPAEQALAERPLAELERLGVATAKSGGRTPGKNPARSRAESRRAGSF